MLQFNQILKIISSFYELATHDVMIGYHFRMIENFDTHLPRIAGFWQLQLTGTIENKGELPFDLINVHRPLKIKVGEIHRWVLLFEKNLKTYDLDKEVHTLWMKKVYLFRDKLKSGLSL